MSILFPTKFLRYFCRDVKLQRYSEIFDHGESKADEDFDIKNIIKRVKDNCKVTMKLHSFIQENKSMICGESDSDDLDPIKKMLLGESHIPSRGSSPANKANSPSRTKDKNDFKFKKSKTVGMSKTSSFGGEKITAKEKHVPTKISV